jgi:diguanylate cyclase
MRVRIAIDDFGAGCSSMVHLKQLAIGQVKIDRSLVRDLARTDEAVIARSLIDLARALGLEVVAGGVETPEAYALLEALGCDAVQGYLLARPATAPETARWLAGYRAHGLGPPVRLDGVLRPD